MALNSSLAALLTRWRETAATLRSEGYTQGADMTERRATELEDCLTALDAETLSVSQAASESGYSAEHVRRMLSENPTLNAGRKGKPLIRRSDLPRKASIAGKAPKLYDPIADARNLMGRQGAT